MLNTRTVLKENDLYLVGDAHYRVADGESGLYRRDTRVLSRYEWRLDGETPQTLAQHEHGPYWLHQQSANANVGYTMRVGLRRDLQLTATELRDTLRVTRYLGDGPHELRLHLNADYLDMFEVRGWPGELGARDVQVARGAAELEGLWEARHQAFYALRALYPGEVFLSTDLCVPLHELAGVIAFTGAQLQEAGLDASVLGHVGDGNFHVLFHAPAGDAGTWERIGVTYDRMVAETLRVGGTCSGEHGVGLHKRRFLRAQHGEALDLMREVKALLDPLNILNPGKVLPDEG